MLVNKWCVTQCMTVQYAPMSKPIHLQQQLLVKQSLLCSLAQLTSSNIGNYLLLVWQEQQAEAARIAAERKRLQQEQAAASCLQTEQKKRLREDQLKHKQLQQVKLVCVVSSLDMHHPALLFGVYIIDFTKGGPSCILSVKAHGEAGRQQQAAMLRAQRAEEERANYEAAMHDLQRNLHFFQQQEEQRLADVERHRQQHLQEEQAQRTALSRCAPDNCTLPCHAMPCIVCT